MTGPRRLLGRRAAWLVPVATAAVVGGAAVIPIAASAGSPQLDPKTPAQLIAAVEQTHVTALSGEVSETADLGLPDLPGGDQGASFSLPSLLTGSHTGRLAVDGPQHQRFALKGTLAESDVVHDGTDVWTYASDTGQATHLVLPSSTGQHPAPTPDATSLTPLAMAQQALDAITPTTGVSVGEATNVAGQDAYTLVLAPKQAGSTISRVVIAVDAARFVPLQVQVYGAGDSTTPVFRSGFTSISYERPSADTFQFTPPAGSTVTTRTLGGGTGQHPDHATTDSTAPSGPRPQVLGKGWTSVLEVPLGAGGLDALAPAGQGEHSSSALLDRLFTTLPNGDRLLQTNLVNALLTSDGRLFVGAVDPSVLQAAATK